MKKAFWWILGILLSPLLLFVVLTVLLYLPPVQNWVVDKVAEVASEKTDMEISVGHVCLSFPLDLAIDDVKVIHHPDTIADVKRLVVDVQLMPLFEKRVVINQLEVLQTKVNTNGFVKAARVKGNVGRLFVTSKGIDLDKQTVEVNGTRLEKAQLDIALSDSVPEDTTKSEALWKIHADSVAIVRSDLTLHMPGDSMSVAAHFGSLTVREAMIDLGSQTYSVGNVDWVNGTVKYDKTFEPPVADLDFNHIDLTNVTIGIDSIYFHNPTLRLTLRQVAMKEKSGLQLANLTGQVVMENGSVRLPKLRLMTPDSDIDVELDLPLSLTEKIDPGKMRLRLNAQLGKADLMRFMGGLPDSFRERWPYYPLSVSGVVRGNLQHMDVTDLAISLPTAFHATATGFAANLDQPQKLLADVQFAADLQDLGFVTTLMPRNMQRNYRIPSMSAEGRVKADGSQYSGELALQEGKGTVKAEGSFNAAAMRYDANLNIRNLNVHHFMPRDSIYTISADIEANGQGVDFLSPRTTLSAEAKIHHVGYAHLNLNNVTAHADVLNGRLHADIISRNTLLDGAINVDALMSRERIDATVSTDFASADLHKIGVVPKPLSIGLCGHFDVTSDLKHSHRLSGLFNDITVRDSSEAYRPGDIGLLVNTRPDTTYVRAQSGDFIVKLDASGDYEQLMSQLVMLGDTVKSQVEERIIDQPAIRRNLPVVKVHIESMKENPIATVLKSGAGVEFKTLLFDLSASPEGGINGNGHVHSLQVNTVKLDTINFRLTQRKERLSFGGQIRNNKKNPQFVFNALFDGVLQERGATIGVRYYDAENRMGARIGAQGEMVDSGLRVHLVPERPTLGYKEFNLNQDNYLFFASDKKVRTKIDLVADDGMGVKIFSEENDTTALQDITVSLNRFDLNEITSVIPYAPRITGIMNGDYHVVQDADRRISVVSDMGVHNMTYERCPIGNVSTELVYLQKSDSAHAVEARLMKDDVEVGALAGTYYNHGEGSLDATLKLTRLPLSLANGFIPDQMLGLQGYGDGELSVRGPLSKPHVNGEMYLDSTYIVSVPYGVALRVDNDPVRIIDSKLMLENFTVYSQHNNSPLTLHGSVDFSNTENMLVDMRLRARNYQLIGATESAKSVAYGKLFVNIFAMLRGSTDNMNLRGRLEVLGTTDLNYVLRDSPLTTDNQLDELVKFTDFSDTTKVVEVERPSLTGLRMDMTVDVSTGAHIKAYLNTSHSNYIDLLGGGTLRMQYNPADNLQLSGRYTLSSGEMKYSLPVIPLKTFTIQNGSYIEFTGDPMNPSLNIIATERTKATVAGEGGAGRSVTFDCGVIISRSVSNIGVEFTLDAPEDMQLHSELQAMSVEQRGKLAVSMLTTGMYLPGDNATGSFSMNSALSSFLSSEINSITGNALRSLDLSIGMDNATDATGNTHTDYSFKFAKRFLNNRLKVAVGGVVTTGAEMQQRDNSFFDNVTLEYRLDDTANKYISLYYQNNAYDWLDGYTRKYGGGFIWRKRIQKLTDIFRFKDPTPSMRPRTMTPRTMTLPSDTLKLKKDEAK